MFSSRAGARKSPHAQVNDSSSDVRITGRASGRKILEKIRHHPQPSMIAASSSSMGMAVKNWRNRKIRYGVPANPQRTHGQYVPTMPMRENRMYVGIKVA